ncbi:MAG: DUF1018 domain-containing protein [Treponema sp.]|nr:DUF1018 domain-containing protein [Treponema sp.]
MQKKSNRSRLIAIIHAQKNAARLDDEVYRAIVYGATGEDSCTDCTMSKLKAIFTDLNIVLEKQGQTPFLYAPRYEQPTQCDAVRTRAKKILGADWQARLDLFIQTKIRPASLSVLTQKELRQVMGFLSAVERRGRA